MKAICKIGGGTGIVLAMCSAAVAADMPLKAPVHGAVYDWTGFYLGGHVGYGGGSFGPGTNPLPEQGVFFPHSVTGLTGGYQPEFGTTFGPRPIGQMIRRSGGFGSSGPAPAFGPEE